MGPVPRPYEVRVAVPVPVTVIRNITRQIEIAVPTEFDQIEYVQVANPVPYDVTVEVYSQPQQVAVPVPRPYEVAIPVPAEVWYDQQRQIPVDVPVPMKSSWINALR